MGRNATTTIDDGCAFPTTYRGNEDPAITVLLALYSAFGLVCAFFGYRVFKAVMFFVGFVFASVVVYLVCSEEEALPGWSGIVVSLCSGLSFGLMTLLVQYVGLFTLGFHSGLLLGLAGLCATAFRYQPPSPWYAVGILLLSGTSVAILNLYFQKGFTIIGSALYGGAVITVVLDYFVENSIMLLWIWDKVKATESKQPCWFSWAILSLWPATLILGMFSQWLLVRNGTYHEKQFKSRSQCRSNPETREERKQRKYRYLYQVRTCHGDVVSQPIAKKYVHQINDESLP